MLWGDRSRISLVKVYYLIGTFLLNIDFLARRAAASETNLNLILNLSIDGP